MVLVALLPLTTEAGHVEAIVESVFLPKNEDIICPLFNIDFFNARDRGGE